MVSTVKNTDYYHHHSPSLLTLKTSSEEPINLTNQIKIPMMKNGCCIQTQRNTHTPNSDNSKEKKMNLDERYQYKVVSIILQYQKNPIIRQVNNVVEVL